MISIVGEQAYHGQIIDETDSSAGWELQMHDIFDAFMLTVVGAVER